MPPEYGKWGTVHQRFIRSRDWWIWEKNLETLIDEPYVEWLVIDGSHCKVHSHAAGAKGDNQGMERTKGGSTVTFIWPWMRWYASQSSCHSWYHSGFTQAITLIDGIEAKSLLADRGYDSNKFINAAVKTGCKAVIPPKK